MARGEKRRMARGERRRKKKRQEAKRELSCSASGTSAELAHKGSPMSAKQAMMPKASQMTSESWRKLSRIFKRSSSTLMPMRYCFCSSLQLQCNVMYVM